MYAGKYVFQVFKNINLFHSKVNLEYMEVHRRIKAMTVFPKNRLYKEIETDI